MNMSRRGFFPRLIQQDAVSDNGHRERSGPSAVVLLRDLPAGDTGQVTALTGGHGLVARLAALGLTPGAVVKVLQNPGHGPLIVLVRQSRLVLGRGEAGHVAVIPVSGTGDEQSI